MIGSGFLIIIMIFIILHVHTLQNYDNIEFLSLITFFEFCYVIGLATLQQTIATIIVITY